MQRPTPQPIADPGVRAICTAAGAQGIVKVPGLPAESEATWVDRAVEFSRRQQELEEQWEAKRQAEREAQNIPEPQTAADIARAAIHQSYTPTSRSDIPLNGPGIIAAAGGNPHATASVADLIRRQLAAEGSVQDGRRE